MTTPTDIVGVTTSGIQDVSAFLPLLGTEQCEEHVSCALERGFFYAAGAPMSIFGSLGIIKAGFTALWVSLDIWWFHGPRQLRNAGFHPKGDQIRSILHRYQTLDVDLNLLCWPWLRWNLLMLFFGIVFGSFGLLPYVYIIRIDFSDRTFSENWLYPMLRVYGGVLAATMIQLIVQLRLLFVLHSRLRFHALNSWFQDQGRVPPVSWNADMRSERCLAQLTDDIAHSETAAEPDTDYEYLYGLEKSAVARRPLSSFHKDETTQSKKINWWPSLPSLLLAFCRILLLCGMAATGVGYIGCFGLVQASNTSINGPGIWLALEVILCILRLMIWASNPGFDDPPPPIAIQKSHGATGHKVTYDIGWMLDDVTVDDLHAVVVGINKAKSISNLQSAVKDAKSVIAYLQDGLAVPEHQITSFFDGSATSGAIENALRKLALNNSIRPGAPIVLYFACHTAERGDMPAAGGQQSTPNATQSGPAATGAPTSRLMMSYDQYMNFPRPQRPLIFVTSDYDQDITDTGLSYTKFLDLLREIAIAKGNNITVILDTCFSGRLGAGRHDKVDKGSAAAATSDFLIGYPTHRAVETEEGGAFTQTLLKHLGSTTTKASSASPRIQIERAILKWVRRQRPKNFSATGTDVRKLTYRDIIKNVRDDPEIKKFRWVNLQTPVCSGNFQNRLLFNGLMASKQLGRDTALNTSVILISSDVDMQKEDSKSQDKDVV
ncbi:hypothetical protein FB451DRAFT_1301492 [Mycena latifolia]|nr:hypothetical protein FB451DRAFT_1301492 [Mycena latifolia]